MNRLLTVIAATGVIFAGAQALAVDSVRQTTMSKRQMIVQIVGCMKKRMAANKSSSYPIELIRRPVVLVELQGDHIRLTVPAHGLQA